MSKPSEFHAEYVVSEHSSFQKTADQTASGHLHIGRVVWLDGDVREEEKPEIVTAYLEPEGFVHVNPQCLKPAPTVR